MKPMTFAVTNAPEIELHRTPAAARIGELARRSGLGLTHFEYRHHLRTPDHWVPADRPDLFGEAHWRAGRLIEPKYGPFRHDSPMGSFHPGHRAKWTAHELCHALVGHAWRPDATPLFLAIGARMAELLPVALYYFLDEAGLRRCPRHAGGGALFSTFCADCERAAEAGPTETADRGWFDRGRAFVEAELAAVARSRRAGRPISHRWATLDLQSDATAYVAAHRLRLQSKTFCRFVEQFPAPGRSHATLDALEARLIEVLDDLCGGASARPLTGDRARWMAHDVAWRMRVVSTTCEGEVADEIGHLVDALADAPDADGITAAIAGYEALFEDWIIPEPDAVFAVGYPLPGDRYGLAIPQAAQGIASIMPGTVELLGDVVMPVVDAFVRGEAPTRGPIARRFARFLAAEAPGPIAEVAAYEAAIAHPGQSDGAFDAFGPDASALDDRIRLAQGAEILGMTVDVRSLAAQAASEPDALPDDLDTVPERPHALAIRRTAGGDVVVAELSTDDADALRALGGRDVPAARSGLSADALTSLRALGFIEPAGWAGVSA